ncbi:MAG: hypothetical protein Q8O72_00765 [Bacteroidales bacterium]|nr:hypothetical protein [Bacteroidales bacterium]
MSAQTEGVPHPDGYTVFYSPDSVVVSEGIMVEGKPNGYWKNYYPDGTLKSEGNRKDFQLDSLWRFYNEDGKLVLEIEYIHGKKNGYRTTYQGDEVTREHFENDVKQGHSYLLSINLKVKSKIPFVNGLEEGIARDYDTTGNVIQLVTYKRGYVIERERINRYNSNGQKHGKWKWFFDDEITVQQEGSYKNGLKDGYWKEYDRDGNLMSATKYMDGEKMEMAEELVKLDMRTDYYPNGKVKVKATYTKDGVPEGVRREYNEIGEVERSFIFRKGKIVAEGIFTDAGKRQGLWKEYYPNGKIKASGNYLDDLREDVWKFYFPKGQLEQIGKYVKGVPDSLWRWYYSNGNMLREENYYNGLEDGTYTEFDDKGNIITTGDYLDGKKEGFWTLEVGDTRKEGNYSEGLRTGIWKIFYPDGTLAFEGKFVDDLPNGKHQWWWPDGKNKKQAEFVMGRRSGELKKFNEDGTLLIVISYKAGKEVKYDGLDTDIDE